MRKMIPGLLAGAVVAFLIVLAAPLAGAIDVVNEPSRFIHATEPGLTGEISQVLGKSSPGLDHMGLIVLVDGRPALVTFGGNTGMNLGVGRCPLTQYSGHLVRGPSWFRQAPFVVMPGASVWNHAFVAQIEAIRAARTVAGVNSGAEAVDRKGCAAEAGVIAKTGAVDAVGNRETGSLMIVDAIVPHWHGITVVNGPATRTAMHTEPCIRHRANFDARLDVASF